MMIEGTVAVRRALSAFCMGSGTFRILYNLIPVNSLPEFRVR